MEVITMESGLTVGQVARVAHVTVRTLHHYDEIGLLSPSARTPAGYRVYGEADLERLQQVLCYRELDFGLDDIRAILDDPEVDALEHLRRQKEILGDRITRLQQMVATVEKTMEARRMGVNLNPDEMFEVFGEQDLHLDEAEQRWGDTDAWKQSQRRTARYTKQDWVTIKAEGDSINHHVEALLTDGVPATDARVMDLAEEHRAHINRWFYDCDLAMHRNLACLFDQDPRYAVNQRDGFGPYLAEAIRANADRRG